ncbi:heparan-alpha-glucosaminide N-acetyltransferase [Agrilus planipennis]|uniref:Heparan-alpha-glucosaminide N-acetyltransferase n=1 Tax=Agrilus planipennis TaxID=224129 RepID=A0A1W4XSQ7_AGRPL|nr:heparan-alpha-glucosaminide N-acetyltransferase [Agrilus planipennis]
MLFDNQNKCASSKPELSYDEACLDVNNFLSQNIEIFGQYAECTKCDFQKLAEVFPNSTANILVNTKYPMLTAFKVNNTLNCVSSNLYYEHYRYEWNVTDLNTCGIKIKVPADNAYLPVLTAMIILFLFGTIWYMIKCIYKCTKHLSLVRRYVPWSTEIQTDLGTPRNDGMPLVVERLPPPVKKHPYRVKSIDVFRGLSIILMIFVNYGGGKYSFFEHSPWNGLTVADLVFPWFLWIMGVSMMISMDKKLREGAPCRQLFNNICWRSLILILIGLVLNSHGRNVPISQLRFPGVLQRIGVTYFIVASLELCTCKRTSAEFGRLWIVQDLLVSWHHWLVMIAFVIIHTSITFALNVPGCGKGYLGPGGLDQHGKYFNCTGGAAGYLDRLFFGNHMYHTPTCHKLYETVQYFDPEGILGTLTATLTVYLGAHAGRILLAYNGFKERVIRWCIWGILTGLMGGWLSNFSKNDGVIPVNKNLWSLSFVLVTASFAFFLEAFLFVVVDVTRKWGGRPFFYPGMNALILYIGHVVFKNTFPFSWIPTVATHGAYLGMNLWGTALWVVVAIVMYKRNIFVSV